MDLEVTHLARKLALKQQTTSIMSVKVCVREDLPNPPKEGTIGR